MLAALGQGAGQVAVARDFSKFNGATPLSFRGGPYRGAVAAGCNLCFEVPETQFNVAFFNAPVKFIAVIQPPKFYYKPESPANTSVCWAVGMLYLMVKLLSAFNI